jgi:hypothetical protein
MTSHTLSTISFVVGLVSLVGMYALAVAGVGRSTRNSAVVVVLFVVGAALTITGVFVGNRAWSSPVAVNTVTQRIVRTANTLGAPATSKQLRATVTAAAAATEQDGGVTTKFVAPYSFTLTLAGDTARTCLTYSSTSVRWSWAAGPCQRLH